MIEQLTPFHAKFFAHELSILHANNGVDRLSQSLFDASVDLDPHQIDAALFAIDNPLTKGVVLADEVGLGKTIEAGLVCNGSDTLIKARGKAFTVCRRAKGKPRAN